MVIMEKTIETNTCGTRGVWLVKNGINYEVHHNFRHAHNGMNCHKFFGNFEKAVKFYGLECKAMDKEYYSN